MELDLNNLFDGQFGAIIAHFYSEDNINNPRDHQFGNLINISCLLNDEKIDSITNRLLQITIKGYGPQDLKGSLKIVLDYDFLEKIGFYRFQVDSLNLIIENLTIVQSAIISNVSDVVNISLSILNNQGPALSINGTYNRIIVNNNRISQISIDSQFLSLILKKNNPCPNTNITSIDIYGNSPKSIFFELNKNYISSEIHVESCEKIKLSSNKFNKFAFANSHFQNLEMSNNSIGHIELENLSPIQNETFATICLKGNKGINLLNLDKLDFGQSFWKFEPKKLSFKKKAKLLINLSANAIETIKLHDVSWDYKSINNNKEIDGYSKRDALIKLKSAYSHQQDNYHERIFKSYEKRWHHDNKSSFPLILSWYSNEFGLSLIRPILWLIFLIALEVFLITIFNWECTRFFIDQFANVIYLLNPAHRTEIFLEIIKDQTCDNKTNLVNWIILIDNIFRIAIGYTLFQFINAFRYKYDLR